ncbi:MAG: beta-ketoacyl synthase N-terminal-like domain-containing protein [Planctomycetota bacterium]
MPRPHVTPPQPAPVRIAGAGLVTPLGLGLWPTFRRILAGECITDRTARLDADTDALSVVRAIGGVARARRQWVDASIEIAEAAVREAAAQAGLRLGHDTPIWLGSSKGAVEAMDRSADAVRLRRRLPDTAGVPAVAPHAVLAHELGARLGAPVVSISAAACASGLVALHAARCAMQAPDGPSQAVVVAVDAGIVPSLIHSYRRLGVLAPPEPDRYRQRPLSQRAQGFVLSECAAALVLDRTMPAKPSELCLGDTAIGCEAYDAVRPPPTLITQTALLRRLWPVETPVAAHHPHAPGTLQHDAAEWAAIQQIEGEREIDPASLAPLYAGKGAIGHSLGAAGLCSTVLACAAHQTGRLPPMPWLTGDAIEGIEGRYDATKPTPIARGSHLVWASGFGGHVAGVRLDPSRNQDRGQTRLPIA